MWLEVDARWQCWSSSCFLLPVCPWEPSAAERFKSKASLSHGHELSCWWQCPVTQCGAQHSSQSTLVALWASHCHPFSFSSCVVQITSYHRPGWNPGPPSQAQCCWDVPGVSTVSASCTVAPVLLLGSFLSLVPGMATRLQNQSMKKLSQQSSDVRKADFSLVAACTECLSLWGKWEGTIILKSLIEWWLIRTVHHRETYSGVNRCLCCILQPWKKISKSTTGYSNLTCSAWEQQLTSPNLCPAA